MSAAHSLADPVHWHSIAYGTYPEIQPRRYQLEYMLAAEKLVDCTLSRKYRCSHNMCAIWARQSGKNESNARLEARLLSKYNRNPLPLEIVKCAPTWRPQCLISKERFKKVTNTPLFHQILKPKWSEGYIVSIGNASMKLVSADPKANNVGLTASLMLTADEMQNIQSEIFDVNFKPMILSTSAPILGAGTSWATDSLLERQRARAAESESVTGIKCLHVIPWDRIAEELPHYGQEVEKDISIYGLDHILIQTQYCCRPVDSAGMLLSGQECDRLIGDHPRGTAPRDGRVYVAGVDFASCREQNEEELLKNPALRKERDSTVVTIGELMHKVDRDTGRKIPFVRIVDHLWVKGLDPAAATDTIYNYIFERWNCVRAVLDANGVGDGPSDTIYRRRPQQVTAMYLTALSKSRLGYDLQGAIKTDRLKIYRPDDSDEWHENFFQLRQCRRLELRENNVMKWGAPRCKIDGRDVHDDFTLSMAYCLEAAQEHLAAHHDPHEYANRGIFQEFSFNAFE